MDYAEAKAFIEKGRNPTYRKVAHNTWVVATTGPDGEPCYGLKFHDTTIIRYLEDGSMTLHTDGWKTVTTLGRMRTYGPGYGIWSEKGAWGIHHASDPLSPPKIQKCRVCHGDGRTALEYEWCHGCDDLARQVKSSWGNRESYHGSHRTDKLHRPTCSNCAGTGTRDFGSRGIPTPFVDGIRVDSTGKVLDVPQHAVQAPYVTTCKPKPYSYGGGYSTGYSYPSYTPAPMTDNDRAASWARGLTGSGVSVACPACEGTATATVDGGIASIVPHLNDYHNWTFDQIADWLESTDDLNVAV